MAAAGFERVVDLAENFGGFDVDRVLLGEFVLLVTGNEGEVVNVPVNFDEPAFTSRTKSESAMSGLMPTSRCR